MHCSCKLGSSGAESQLRSLSSGPNDSLGHKTVSYAARFSLPAKMRFLK